MNNLTKKANLVRECNQLYKKIIKLSNYMNSREFSKLPEDEQVIIAEQYKHMSLQHELYADRIEMLERKLTLDDNKKYIADIKKSMSGGYMKKTQKYISKIINYM